MKKSLVLVLGFVLALTATPFVEKSQAKDKVTLGIAISQTGRYAEPAGRMVNSYNLYVDQMNAKGGWLGKKIDMIILDDKSDKQTSIKLYEKLITQDRVDLTMGPYSSGITDAVANVLERYKYPTLAPGAASGIIWKKGRKYLFDIIAVAQDYQKGALHIARDIGVKRIAIIGEDSLFPRQSAEGAVDWAKKLGLKVVLNENYPRKQTDFTALLQKIKARRAEALISNSYFADAAAQIRQLRELNINMKIFAGTVGPGLPKFAKQLGNTAEYVLGFSQWEPKPEILKRPGMRAFIAAYEKRYGVKPNYHAGQSYASMQVFGEAVKRAGSIDRDKVWRTMRTMSTTTIIGPWKVDETGMNNHEGLTFQILDGQRKIVWPKKISEVPYKLPMPKWKDRAKN
ncbi:MAG: amino acid ABC transporter substrate-binding protein [Nitrospinae bacterium]|nr:amino acid ABC transporter substrate-binding protein [Nitrospinota bacterium]